MEPQWLKWGKKLQAIAQNGLTYSQNNFDLERFEQIRSIAVEMMSLNSGIEVEYFQNIFLKEEGYATPKVDVRGAVFNNDRILMVKEKLDGLWTLPGGWADPDETPSESVEREVFEESGFIVKAERIAALLDRTKQNHTPFYPFHVYKIFFFCTLIGGKASVSNETEEVGFFSDDKIPPLSTGRININQIKLLFRKFRDNDISADFD